MSNTFIVPQTIAALGLANLYNTTVFGNLVWRDFDDSFTGSVGNVVNVRKPAIFTANVFDRSAGITVQSAVEDKVALTLDTIADVSFNVTSEELTLDIDSFNTRLLQPAMIALVEKVDRDIANALSAAATGAGGGGTVTMATVASDAFAAARGKLTRSNLPQSERYGVLSPEATTVALADPQLVRASWAGSTDALRESNIGKIFGVQSMESSQLGYGVGAAGSADGLIFHKTALVLASRPLAAPQGVSTEQYSIQNYMGLSLRVVQLYDITKKQDIISLDILYGLKATRPQGSVLINMGQGS